MEEDETPHQAAGRDQPAGRQDDGAGTLDPSGAPDPPGAPPATPGAPDLPGAPGNAPTPRRDPYADFGNPLHDTWGTRSAQVSAPPEPLHVGRQRKKRPGLKWAITALVVVALAIAAWFARDALGDAWNWVYDKAENVTGDSGDDTPDPVDTTQPTGLDPDAVARVADENAAAFDDWMDSNEDAVSAAADRLQAASRTMEPLTADAASGSGVDPADYRAASIEFRDSILGLVDTLDDAPTSTIRDDFVRILLVQLNDANEIVESSDAGDPSGLQRSARDLQSAATETMRLCRQYGKRAQALCE